MGYTTYFDGEISVVPPLNEQEIEFLKKFNETRRMKREKGPYYVDGKGFAGQEHEADVINFNGPPDGQPGLWCQWTPTDDGEFIVWDGGEKFYEPEEWMKYLIEHFIGIAPLARKELPFLQSHVLNGIIAAQGEDSEDRWDLIVQDNEVFVQDYQFVQTDYRKV